MIDTVMALWNRGWKGRVFVVFFTFAGMCIGISLLVITTGSAWGVLFAHRPGTGTGSGYGYTSTTAGAHSPTASATTSGISIPGQCLVTGTATALASPSVGATPPVSHRASPTPTRGRPYRQPTPTPVGTKPPVRRPTPSPVVTKTPVATPTLPVAPTVVPTQVTTTPTTPPTPVITPTAMPVTPTPIVTPTITATPVVTPPITATVSLSPTVSTCAPQPTDTPGTSTPTTTVTNTTGTPGNTHSTGGHPLSGGGGTPSAGASDTTGTPSGTNTPGSCLIDSISGAAAPLLLLEECLWVTLITSLAGTIIFCGAIARRCRSRASNLEYTS